jgi:hypothetical protein
MKIVDNILGFFIRLFLLPGKRAQKKFNEEFIKNYRFIEIVDDGFFIKNIENKIFSDIKWYNVKDATYSESEIVIYQNQEEILIPNKYDNWYWLLREIPEGYVKFDYKSVRSFFEQLQGCEICGLIAVNNGECLSCANEVWNSELANDYKSKEDYIREMQYDEFEPNNENEELVINNKADFGFKSYSYWVPLVSKDDY